jgi:hypothetical protein
MKPMGRATRPIVLGVVCLLSALEALERGNTSLAAVALAFGLALFVAGGAVVWRRRHGR